MDSEERALRKEELELTRRHNRATVITAAVIAVLSNAVVVGVAVATLRTTATQFELSSRASEYNDIVQGLSSPASAVEINSMRRLQTNIENEDNFPDVEGQQAEATNAVQTLIAYIKENGSSTGEGLADYMSSHPPVVPPAVSRLRQLLSNSSLGENSVDLALVDMHGLRNLQEFSPHGTDSYLPGVDLRGAYLWKVDLTGVHYSSMRRSFLTCADLTDAHMGGTDLTFADLSGADLTGADLGQVRGLTSQQLTGATTDDETHLPEGVEVPAGTPWDGDACQRYVKDMTGFRPGTGYDPEVPCPTASEVCSARSPRP
jgi:hypothetical protein